MLADLKKRGIVLRKPKPGQIVRRAKANKLVTLVRTRPVRVITLNGKTKVTYVTRPKVPLRVIGKPKHQRVRTLTFEQFEKQEAARRKVEDTARARFSEQLDRELEIERMRKFARENGVLEPSGKVKKLKPMKFPKNIRTLSWKQFVAEEERKKHGAK